MSSLLYRLTTATIIPSPDILTLSSICSISSQESTYILKWQRSTATARLDGAQVEHMAEKKTSHRQPKRSCHTAIKHRAAAIAPFSWNISQPLILRSGPMSHLHDNLPAKYASEKKRGFDWPFQDSCNLLWADYDYKLDLSRRYSGAGVSMIRSFLALTLGSRKS